MVRGGGGIDVFVCLFGCWWVVDGWVDGWGWLELAVFVSSTQKTKRVTEEKYLRRFRSFKLPPPVVAQERPKHK